MVSSLKDFMLLSQGDQRTCGALQAVQTKPSEAVAQLSVLVVPFSIGPRTQAVPQDRYSLPETDRGRPRLLSSHFMLQLAV